MKIASEIGREGVVYGKFSSTIQYVKLEVRFVFFLSFLFLLNVKCHGKINVLVHFSISQTRWQHHWCVFCQPCSPEFSSIQRNCQASITNCSYLPHSINVNSCFSCYCIIVRWACLLSCSDHILEIVGMSICSLIA